MAADHLLTRFVFFLQMLKRQTRPGRRLRRLRRAARVRPCPAVGAPSSRWRRARSCARHSFRGGLRACVPAPPSVLRHRVGAVLMLPRPSADSLRNLNGSQTNPTAEIFNEFGRTFVTFFQKKGVLTALLFMLLYRLPEAFLVKMMNPFLLDPVDKGGLGLTTQAVGLIYGTIGIAALTAGGILGGIAASRWGLKKSLWPMAMALTLPCLSFVFLSAFQPDNLWITGTCVALDQFGYGFGFTAYMLYLIYFSEGEFKTAHYSLCTAFMALSMMLPGMVAGYIQESIGYTWFFGFVMVCCLVTVLVTFLVKVDPQYGRKK